MKHNNLISKKHKKICKYLNYVNNCLKLASTVTGCASTSAFPSLDWVPFSISSSTVGTKICAWIKNYQSNIKK